MKIDVLALFLVLQFVVSITISCQPAQEFTVDDIQILSDETSQFFQENVGNDMLTVEKDTLSDRFERAVRKLKMNRHGFAIRLVDSESESNERFEQIMPEIHKFLLHNMNEKQYVFLNIYRQDDKLVPTIRVHNLDKSLSENIDLEKTLFRQLANTRLNDGASMGVLDFAYMLILHYQSNLFNSGGEEVILEDSGDGKAVTERYN